MKSDKQFSSTLSGNICQRGAMDKLISYRVQVEIRNKVKDMLLMPLIDDWNSEPHKQFQNPVELRY